jgi:hypothetical protein
MEESGLQQSSSAPDAVLSGSDIASAVAQLLPGTLARWFAQHTLRESARQHGWLLLIQERGVCGGHLEGGEGNAHDFADVLAKDGLPQGCADGGVGVADAHRLEDGLPCKYPSNGAAECLQCIPYLKLCAQNDFLGENRNFIKLVRLGL